MAMIHGMPRYLLENCLLRVPTTRKSALCADHVGVGLELEL